METGAGVTMGLMLARGVALLPADGLGLLLGDGVLGVGRMLAVGGSDRLELTRKNKELRLTAGTVLVVLVLVFMKVPSPLLSRTLEGLLSLVQNSRLITNLGRNKQVH